MKNKNDLRNELLAQRRALDSNLAREWSRAIQDQLNMLKFFETAKQVLSYLPVDKEVSTLNIIEALLENQKTVLAPSIDETNDMTWRRILSLNDLRIGKFGIPEPAPENQIELNDTFAAAPILVPGVAFDRAGNRLGFGAGYFDRFLASHSGTKIGLAYEFQIMDRLPQEAHDVQMDWIVTENGCIET